MARSINQFTAALVVLLPFWTAVAGQIDTPYFRFTIGVPNGDCELLDKKTRVTWRSDAAHPGLGSARLISHEQTVRIPLTNCVVVSNGKELRASFQPFAAHPLTFLHVIARAVDPKTLELSYQEDNELDVESVALLEDLLSVTDEGPGYVLVPAREGLLIPADSGLEFTHRFDTYAYEGCHMQMLGAVQKGAALLLTWPDPYAAAQVKSTVNKAAPAGQRQTVTPSLVLRKSARSFRVQFLGKGDYVDIAKAYRKVAIERGWFVPWEQKLKTDPDRAKLFGAANIKLWSALDRRMNEASTKEESVRVNWTFDEAAQVAEHFKRDLKLERVLLTLGGWIHRGYDNQHPDILPTAPECGGDAAFADCARRVMDLGYLFCLHDNYQDIYRDSPSWDEQLVMKTADGQLARGGHWAGGLAYLTCSKMAAELAKRPQNLPAVKKLSNANSYFIDTTYAAGLQECYDTNHWLTRRDDIKWKQELSDYARQVFGVFGSECGREWAIPHSDFFEGLTGVSGHYYHDATLPAKLGATVVPLFDLVYRDCIAMYGKYGYNPQRAAEYVLHHISLARPLNYHSIPPHLYWQRPQPADRPAPASSLSPGDPALFARADNGWAADLHPLDRFIKNTCEILCPLNELTAQLPMTRHDFLTQDRTVQRTVFGEGAAATTVVVNTGPTNYVCHSKLGGQVVLPSYGFLAESPMFVAFHALNWAGVPYAAPTIFTLRSLDARPLARSRNVRVYHACGDYQIRIAGRLSSITREEVIHPGAPKPPQSSK